MIRQTLNVQRELCESYHKPGQIKTRPQSSSSPVESILALPDGQGDVGIVGRQA